MPEREPVNGNTQPSTDGTDRSSKRILPASTGLLNRRSLLKVAGVTAIGSVLASTTASAASTTYDTVLVVDGRDVSGTTSYTFSVDGEVTTVDRTGATSDAISSGTVTGEVSDDVHGYWYSGDVVSLETVGPAPLLFGSDADSILPEPEYEFVVRSDTVVDYEFTTDGPVRKLLDNGKNSAEDGNDDVVDNGDGTYTVSGYTGNGYGDGYAVQGSVVEFSPMVGDYELVFDGQTVTAEELTGNDPTRELVIASDTEVSYEFTVDGDAMRLTDNGKYSAESGNDDVVDNGDGTTTVTGYTGNGYGDGFAITGPVTDFSPLRGDVDVTLDGQSTTTYELVGQEPPEPSDTVIGGGSGYASTVPQSEADYTATSRAELHDALGAASSGDVVYVPGSAAIHASQETFHVPGGVTLASDRGIDGSAGGVIYETSDTSERLLKVQEDDSTITGLRIRGPHHDEENAGGGAWDHAHVGVQVSGRNAVLANCEIYGWGYAGISCNGNTHVHHCHVHHNTLGGLGYGLLVSSNAETLVEYTLFGRNRHCIAAHSDASYTARYNVVEADQRHHIFDHHGSGGRVEVYNNTFKPTPATVDGYPSAYRQRACAESTSLHHNWAYNPNPPNYDDPGDKEATFANPSSCGFANTDIHDNHYGTDQPPSGIGAP